MLWWITLSWFALPFTVVTFAAFIVAMKKLSGAK